MPATLAASVAAALLCLSHAASAAAGDIFMRTMPDGSVKLSNVPEDDGYERVLSASPAGRANAGSSDPPAAPPAGFPFAERLAHYRGLVAEAAQRADVEARLLHAVIAVESGYNVHAVSRKGAVGLMQLMPATARRYGVVDASDPRQNLLGGASYLRDLLRLFKNDLSLALAAYNAGENAVIRSGHRIPAIRETAAYVPKVLSMYRRFEAF